MLKPGDRKLLLDTLRPPEGYRFDRTIGTTFTLDLESLLTVPLAFTFFDWEDATGRPSADPLALLEAVRRHAGRIHLFCQAGQINVPTANQPLLTYIEDTVIQVRPPRHNGLFHPKVWVVRFAPLDPQEPVMYRLLCMSRNLTHSRSWDTSLVLDGLLKDRKQPIRRNRPLGDFIEALPTMAVESPSRSVIEAINTVNREIRRVDFELPEGFDDLRFHPMGHDAVNGWPFPDNPRNFLVLSPFVSSTFVRRLAKTHCLQHLISRPESLASLPHKAFELAECTWVMSPQAELDCYEGADDGGSAPTTTGPRFEEDELVGLHAKLFVMDDGWQARVWTGSANATEAAFGRNVEFMVELTGRKSRCGIAAFLGDEEREDGLRPLLERFSNDIKEEEDPERDRLRRRLENAINALLDASLMISVDEVNDQCFNLVVTANQALKFPTGLQVKLWPVTLPSGVAQTLEEATPCIQFPELSIGAITSFIAFHLRTGSGNKVEEKRFVLRLPIRGAPPDRRERILKQLLTNADQVMRLLLLLLSDEGLSAHDFIKPGQGSGTGMVFGALGGSTLLEAMLRALHRNPESLDHVENLIQDLRHTSEGQTLLPPDLDQIWEPIRRARREMRS